MKKTIFTLATALMLSATGIYANTTNFEIKKSNNLSTISAELSSFCKAIMQGDLETVKKLISLGEDVNQKSLGMTPAHFAARYNKAEILKVLIDNGANLKARCDKGYSVKKHAELSSANDVIEVLKSAMKR